MSCCGASVRRLRGSAVSNVLRPTMGRPGLPRGTYFRLLLIGYFEDLYSEHGIAWRAADSLAVARFPGLFAYRGVRTSVCRCESQFVTVAEVPWKLIRPSASIVIVAGCSGPTNPPADMPIIK